jgi:hypothetical protein
LRRAKENKTDFEKKLIVLKRNKVAIFKKMKAQASDTKTIQYYSKKDNHLGNDSIDVIDL